MPGPAVWLATGFGLGYLPIAPATWASFAVAAALAAVTLRAPLDPYVLTAALAVSIVAGVWSSGVAEKTLGHDAKPIVIDEIAGMLLSVWLVPLGSRPVVALFLAFAFFRVYDIWKPGPIRSSQKLPGGWGVVADDLLAGVATNLTLRVLMPLVGGGLGRSMSPWGGAP
jgi:phosphatidylglycerophosphatase A